MVSGAPTRPRRNRRRPAGSRAARAAAPSSTRCASLDRPQESRQLVVGQAVRPGKSDLPPRVVRYSTAHRKETPMAFRINHIHLKAPDPRKTAEWYVGAFNFKIVGDETRVFGDRFIRCMSEDGALAVNISGARKNETLGPGDAAAHHGLEH